MVVWSLQETMTGHSLLAVFISIKKRGGIAPFILYKSYFCEHGMMSKRQGSSAPCISWMRAQPRGFEVRVVWGCSLTDSTDI